LPLQPGAVNPALVGASTSSASAPAKSEAEQQAEYERRAEILANKQKDAEARAYIDNLRKEYSNKDGNFMRSVGAQAIDPEGNPVYWKRGENGSDGSWAKMPGYHPASRQGWYSPELVSALQRTGAVPSDDKFPTDKRSWYEKPFRDPEGTVKLNLKAPAPAAPAPAQSGETETSAKEGPGVRPEVANALNTPGKDAAKESGYQPIKTINGVKTFDPLNLGRDDPKENVELHEMASQLNLLAEELTEWSMSDRIHKDVPYSYSDAATDAGIAGLGALATYATGGLAAPLVGAATAARGGRLANMVYKGVQGAKNVAKGAKEIATNPEVRAVANKNLPSVATTGVKTGTTSAGITTGLNAANDAIDETNVDSSSAELERIKKLSKG
jgi:hypothetical protein